MKNFGWMMSISFLFSTLVIEANESRAEPHLLNYDLWECPGHPTPNEIKEQEERKERARDPNREVLNEDQKKEHDKNNGAELC